MDSYESEKKSQEMWAKEERKGRTVTETITSAIEEEGKKTERVPLGDKEPVLILVGDLEPGDVFHFGSGHEYRFIKFVKEGDFLDVVQTAKCPMKEALSDGFVCEFIEKGTNYFSDKLRDKVYLCSQVGAPEFNDWWDDPTDRSRLAQIMRERAKKGEIK